MTYMPHSEPVSDIALILEGYRPTPLVDCPALARIANVARVLVKAEGDRPLGNFKVLGGMVAGLRALAKAAGAGMVRDLLAQGKRPYGTLPCLICASDGNHGLAVAAAADRAGARASIYLPRGVSQSRAARIEALGGEVVWVSGTYDDAVRDAAAAAARGEGLLIPDTTADPNDAVVRGVMAGYAVLTGEIVAQCDDLNDRPSHMFVQAGVGGLAAAMADGVRQIMREPAALLVVEPESASCVARALACGRPVHIPGDLHTCAEMLSCGLASAPALEVLLRHDAQSVLVREDQLQSAVIAFHDPTNIATTPSGAAGLAGLLHVASQTDLRARHRLGSDSTILLVATEQAQQGCGE